MSGYQQPSYSLHCVSLLHTPKTSGDSFLLLQLCSRDCRLRLSKRVSHVSGRIVQFTAFLLVCIICNCCWRGDRGKKWTVRRNIGRTRVCLLIFHSFFYVTRKVSFCGQASQFILRIDSEACAHEMLEINVKQPLVCLQWSVCRKDVTLFPWYSVQ